MERKSFFSTRHPIVNIIYLIGMLVISMMTMHPILLGTSFLLSSLYLFFLKGRKAIKVSIWMAIPVLLFSAILLPLFSHNGVTPIFYLNGMAVTLETVIYGMVMTLLLVTVFQWFQVWNQLIDNEKFLYLFGRILPSVGLLLSMTFRLLPLMRSRYKEIHDAQRGMGRVEKKRRSRLLIKELSILISWSLENSIETSVSMESRGYGAGKRTSFHLFRFQKEDGFLCAILLILLVVTFVSIGRGNFVMYFFPEIDGTVLKDGQIMGISAFAAMGGLPIVTDLLFEQFQGRRGK